MIPAKAFILIGGKSNRFGSPKWKAVIDVQTVLDRIWGSSTEFENRFVVGKEKHADLTIFSVYPGIVDTQMQAEIRKADVNLFPLLSKFTNYYNNNKLENTKIVAQKLLYIIKNYTKYRQNILSIRDVNIN